MGWWVSDLLQSQGPVAVVSWVAVVIISIVLHELAHGWAAIRLGDRTPIELGHMTWNPLVHMGGFSLLLLAILGIAYGAMPVDPSRLRGRYAETLVALAGPAMNLLLAAVSIVLLGVWVEIGRRTSVDDTVLRNWATFLTMGGALNVVLCLFNLVPVFPLDGGRIAANLSSDYARFAMSENGRWVMLGGLVLLFWFAGDVLFAAGFTALEIGTSVVRAVIAAVLGPVSGASP